MRRSILTMICLAFFTLAYTQDAASFYEQGLEKAQAGEIDEAIALFSKSIELQPEDYFSWYNRGIARSMVHEYEAALPDFEQVVKLAPDYKKGYLNRGTTKKRLTDYEGAMADYSYAIKLDPNYAEAYYNRGLIYDMLDKRDSACADFTKAKELGIESAEEKVDRCNDTTATAIPIHSILRLTRTADNAKYGFTPEQPILVGTGSEGGPANQRAYLNLLRDGKGKAIEYERLGSCCGYPSENGLFGTALVDRYEIKYLNEKGKEKKADVYISMYDYEEPQILHGFKTVGQK